MAYHYIAAPPGQDPAAFTRYIVSLVPGAPVQRDTSTSAYILRVTDATYDAWQSRLPSPPAAEKAEQPPAAEPEAAAPEPEPEPDPEPEPEPQTAATKPAKRTRKRGA